MASTLQSDESQRAGRPCRASLRRTAQISAKLPSDPPGRLVVNGCQSSEVNMNRDVFAGWWKQARGQAKSWWGQLTDDDLDRIEGESDKLIGALQTRYGWSREEAEKEIERGMGRG